MAKNRYLSLDLELADLGASVEGARLLLAGLQMPSGARTREEAQALSSGLALLGLVVERLSLLQRAVRRDVDPALLLSSTNTTGDASEPGVVPVRPWSVEEALARHGEELQRLRLVRGRRAGRGGRR